MTSPSQAPVDARGMNNSEIAEAFLDVAGLLECRAWDTEGGEPSVTPKRVTAETTPRNRKHRESRAAGSLRNP